jgi:predicted transcriptional regulator
MPHTQSPQLTDAELRIMRSLWELDRPTVTEVVDHLHQQGGATPAYNSVLTILRILERKGHVSHHKDGRAFRFAPLIDRGSARKSALAHVVRRFFDNSPELLVLDLLGRDRIDEQELQHLRRLVDTAPAPAGKRKARK